MLLATLLNSPIVSARQPVVIIKALSGNVSVSLQGDKLQKAKVGNLLGYGDRLETEPRSTATLELPDRNQLLISENIDLKIVKLTPILLSGGWKSLVMQSSTKVQAFLDPGAQGQGYSFVMKTPNSLLATNHNQPQIKMSYDPHKNMTTVSTYAADVTVFNLLTEKTKTIHRGNMATVQGQTIWTAPIYGELFSSRVQKARPTLAQKRQITTASLPGQQVQKTSQVQPGIRNVPKPTQRGRPESSRPTPHTIELTISRY